VNALSSNASTIKHTHTHTHTHKIFTFSWVLQKFLPFKKDIIQLFKKRKFWHSMYTTTWMNYGTFLFLQYWGLNSGPTPWATLPALFLWRVFWDRVLWTICTGLSSNREPPDLCLE
jgi:hypothetical protein